MSVLGVDIGGTKVACGIVDGAARVVKSGIVPTLARDGYDTSIRQVYTAIEQCLTPATEAIGMCAPGPLNPITGVVLNPPNLPGWRDVPLRELVARRYDLPCAVENDANAAGLAETLFGAARGYSIVFYATISTGIGSGIILNQKIFHGKNGAAAEGGHVTIDYRSSAVCNCGSPGCIEALASGTALSNRGLDPAALSENELDQLAVKIAAWLGSVISLLDPEVIVIGGGISRIGEPLFARIRNEVPRRTINQFASQIPILPASLGADVGILGAAAVAMSQLKA